MEMLREALLGMNDNQTVPLTEGNECNAEFIQNLTDFLIRSELCTAVEVPIPAVISETSAQKFNLDHVLTLLSLPSPWRFRICGSVRAGGFQCPSCGLQQ